MVMTMRTDKKWEMPRSSIVYSCRGREGGDWVNNCSKQPSWSFDEEQDSNDDVDGALIMLRMIFTIKAHNL